MEARIQPFWGFCHVGGCPSYGPFLAPYDNTALMGTQKGTIKNGNHPCMQVADPDLER